MAAQYKLGGAILRLYTYPGLPGSGLDQGRPTGGPGAAGGPTKFFFILFSVQLCFEIIRICFECDFCGLRNYSYFLKRFSQASKRLALF